MPYTKGKTELEVLAIYESLDGLMWMESWSYPYTGGYAVIHGIIKPDLSLTDPAALRTGLMASFNKIIEVLLEAEVPLASHPRLEITGSVSYRLGTPELTGIKAEVSIEIYPR